MKPVARPNVMRQMILGALLDNKQVFVPPADKDSGLPGSWRPTLANNVSALNVDRMARRWIK
ncbi:hypothetical protein CG716_05175 [Mycolicibacterium sphagni]|uniref:Uncharacterized protein n=1 Tax=Mycolicibacterium sphagni TaxID=1786 RepID=A0A255DQM3_9MYCO|nr:hypothetical protein CG716_05175 [Mycolicibacterium sphagni]